VAAQTARPGAVFQLLEWHRYCWTLERVFEQVGPPQVRMVSETDLTPLPISAVAASSAVAAGSIVLGRSGNGEPGCTRPETPACGPSGERLVIRVGGRFTAAARTSGEQQVACRILSHGPVLLAAAQAEAANATGGAAARVICSAAQQAAERARIETLRGAFGPVIGTAGIARAVIAFGSSGSSIATLEQVRSATDTLASAWVERANKRAPPQWVEPMLIGAAVIGAILECLGATAIAAEAESPGRPSSQAG
jgi:hypothetical protein